VLVKHMEAGKSPAPPLVNLNFNNHTLLKLLPTMTCHHPHLNRLRAFVHLRYAAGSS
jgi:hypothetical protein